MRSALALAGLVLLAAGAWLYLTAPERHGFHASAARGPVSLSDFEDAAGRPVSLASFRGKLVVLNLWAAWCAPCLEEMPALDRLAGKLPPDRFAVVAVTEAGPGDALARRAFDRLRLAHLALYLDPAGNIAREMGARGTPTTVILGPRGEALAYREGAAEWDSDAMISYLTKLAGPAPRS
ncbi:MAG: TlpA disulfide reductase family protein [Roseiarcus sp.]